MRCASTRFWGLSVKISWLRLCDWNPKLLLYCLRLPPGHPNFDLFGSLFIFTPLHFWFTALHLPLFLGLPVFVQGLLILIYFFYFITCMGNTSVYSPKLTHSVSNKSLFYNACLHCTTVHVYSPIHSIYIQWYVWWLRRRGFWRVGSGYFFVLEDIGSITWWLHRRGQVVVCLHLRLVASEGAGSGFILCSMSEE